MLKAKGTVAEEGQSAGTTLVKRNNIRFTVAFAEGYHNKIRHYYNVIYLCSRAIGYFLL